MGLVVGMINTKNLEIGGEIPLANPSLKSPNPPLTKGAGGISGRPVVRARDAP